MHQDIAVIKFAEIVPGTVSSAFSKGRRIPQDALAKLMEDPDWEYLLTQFNEAPQAHVVA